MKTIKFIFITVFSLSIFTSCDLLFDQLLNNGDIPEIRFANLKENMKVWNTVNVELATEGDGELERVNLYVNGEFTDNLELFNARFEWDSRMYEDGNYTISIEGETSSGELTDMISIDIEIYNKLLEIEANQDILNDYNVMIIVADADGNRLNDLVLTSSDAGMYYLERPQDFNDSTFDVYYIERYMHSEEIQYYTDFYTEYKPGRLNVKYFDFGNYTDLGTFDVTTTANAPNISGDYGIMSVITGAYLVTDLVSRQWNLPLREFPGSNYNRNFLMRYTENGTEKGVLIENLQAGNTYELDFNNSFTLNNSVETFSISGSVANTNYIIGYQDINMYGGYYLDYRVNGVRDNKTSLYYDDLGGQLNAYITYSFSRNEQMGYFSSRRTEGVVSDLSHMNANPSLLSSNINNFALDFSEDDFDMAIVSFVSSTQQGSFFAMIKSNREGFNLVDLPNDIHSSFDGLINVWNSMQFNYSDCMKFQTEGKDYYTYTARRALREDYDLTVFDMKGVTLYEPSAARAAMSIEGLYTEKEYHERYVYPDFFGRPDYKSQAGLK